VFVGYRTPVRLVKSEQSRQGGSSWMVDRVRSTLAGRPGLLPALHPCGSGTAPLPAGGQPLTLARLSPKGIGACHVGVRA
jgi:hypothetical protein